jgi:curved DNA-binding protein CbpA
MTAEIDYYELLEVERTADDKTIKSSYRKLAMRFHPGQEPGLRRFRRRFKAISQAYDCLKDPQKRAAYDRYGHAAFENGGMGGGGGRRRLQRYRRYLRIDLRQRLWRRRGASRRGAARTCAMTWKSARRGVPRQDRRDRDRCFADLRSVFAVRAPSRAPARGAARCAAATARSARSRASSWSSAPARPAMAAAR